MSDLNISEMEELHKIQTEHNAVKEKLGEWFGVNHTTSRERMQIDTLLKWVTRTEKDSIPFSERKV